MKSIKLLPQTFFYIAIVLNLTFAVAVIKVGTTFFCEQLLYKIFLIGELFNILDIGEFVNVIAFALLGMGFGLASGLLPKQAQIKTSAILLIILVPIIFTTSAFTKYTFWLDEFAAKEGITVFKAEKITNSFLDKKVGINGFLGFYLYSGQFPVLPTTQDEIVKYEDIEQRVKSQFGILTKIIKVKPEIISGVLGCGNWAIRFFYFSLAVLTVGTHFHLGREEITKRIKPDAPMFPPVAPRFQPPSKKSATYQPSPKKVRSNS